jgi:hypothetical protein
VRTSALGCPRTVPRCRVVLGNGAPTWQAAMTLTPLFRYNPDQLDTVM